MKKLMVLLAMLAMILIVAAPAIAQIDQESEQEAESGEVDQSFEVSSSGANSNQCAGIQGVANTSSSTRWAPTST
jgi:Tfp pilus assembly protein FimT